MHPVDHAASLLRIFEIEPQPFDRLVERYLARHRDLHSRERRACVDAAYGVIRWWRRLDGWLLASGVQRITHRHRVLAWLAWKQLEQDEISPSFAGVEIPFSLDDALKLEPQAFPGGAAAYAAFPDMLFARMQGQFGWEGAGEMADALNQEAKPCLRLTRLADTREQIIEGLRGGGIPCEPTEVSPYGIRLERRVALARIEAYQQGLLEVQDEASQLAVIAAQPVSGGQVLDCCAGAGGKSLMLSMLMQGKGTVVASDVDANKLSRLQRRARRSGQKNIRCVPAEQLFSGNAGIPAAYDLVFLDAPCTGTGTLRRNPDLKWRLDEGLIAQRRALQLKLLQSTAAAVKPGGLLMYVTCSILQEENEDVVWEFLDRSPFEIVHLGEVFKPYGTASRGILTGEGFLKTDPRDQAWDGFFVAKLRRG